MAVDAFLAPFSAMPFSRDLPESRLVRDAPVRQFEAHESPGLLAGSSPSAFCAAVVAIACVTRASRRRVRAKAGGGGRSARRIVGQAQSDCAVLAEQSDCAVLGIGPDWFLQGPAGESVASFPFPHWLWQHGIARFEAAKLADPNAIARADLAAAWELHHGCGYISHASIEDERVFPALLSLDGGEAAVAELGACHDQLDALAQAISQCLLEGAGDEELRPLLREWSVQLVAHMDQEESLLVPLVSTMTADAEAELSSALKKGMKRVPGSKMILSLFRDLAAAGGVVGEKYEKSFPGILRNLLIPIFARTNKQYAEHRRIFGDLAAETGAPDLVAATTPEIAAASAPELVAVTTPTP